MRRFIVYLVLFIVLFLTACSNDEEKDTEDNESKESGVAEKEQAGTSKGTNTYPLTGIKTDQSVTNRIVSVMVNNHPKARPQTGLSKADIVFEILAEGRVTRFMAMYQSELPDVVGPVRSAREYYFELADGYDSLYIYHGAANFVNDMIKNRGINYLDGAHHNDDGRLFERESFRQKPHNSYLQTGAVYDRAEERGYDTASTYDPLPFATEEEAANISGDTANNVAIDYSRGGIRYVVRYRYQANNETYTRYSDGEQTVERKTDKPITADNIFIVETPHQVIDDAGRRKIDITSGGDAYLIQKGNVREVQWENRDGRIIPVKNGEPVNFVQGQTWINIVPSNPGIDESVTLSSE